MPMGCMCFQVFCCHWIISQQIVPLIEKEGIGIECVLFVKFAAILAEISKINLLSS